MGRKEKQKSTEIEHAQHDEGSKDGSSTPILVFSSDDEDANQDLSLKIVEKAMRMRAVNLAPIDDASGVEVGVVSNASSLQQPESVAVRDDVVFDGPSKILASEVMEERKTVLMVGSEDQSVIVAAEQEKLEIIRTTENDESVEASTVQMGDNMVLRKLLRGPRYFDPPDSGWGSCYNCGEEGHTAVNCTAAKRKKPCYVCGGLGHAAKKCTKAQDCFICKKAGHRAKDCPVKNRGASKSLTICLKCGDPGHDMFSCKNDYALDDLKEIQCYVCKGFGHLCCVNTTENSIPRELSCYRCGHLGHTGLECSRLRGETTDAATPTSCYKCGEEGHFARECTSSIKASSRWQGENTGAGTPSSCYKCGLEGHFARECTTFKAGKRAREVSNTNSMRSYQENDHIGYSSAPHVIGKTRKKKRLHTEERGFTTPKKSKRRGGWDMEYPTEERGYTTPKKSKGRGGWMMEYPTEERGFTTYKSSKSRGGWMMEYPTEERGFTTPNKSKSRGGWMTEHPGEFSPSKSKRNSWRSAGTSSSTKIHSSSRWSHAGASSKSHGSAKAPHHRYSASRFGSSSRDGHGRSYNNWW